MCRSTSISLPLGQPRLHRRRRPERRGGARRPPRRSPRSPAPRAPSRGRPRGACARSRRRRAQPVVADQPLELGGERVDVAGLEQQPEVLVAADDLLVGRRGATRPARRPRRARARAGPGAGATPSEAATATSAAASTSAWLVSSADSTRTRSIRRERIVGAAPEGTNTVACHSSSGGSRRSARRNSRSAPRSSWSQKAMFGSRPPSGSARSRRRGAGAQDAVVGGEDPLHQVARGLERRRAGVEAAEEQLDEAARHLRREHALGGRVEGADVERARVAQRDRRGAGGERLVDVHEVGRRASRAPPRSCARCRAAAPASRRAARPPAAAARRRPAPAPRPPGANSSPARISRRESRTSAVECVGASTTTRWPSRASSPDRASTKALTSCSSSQGYGETWAMEKRSGTAAEA